MSHEQEYKGGEVEEQLIPGKTPVEDGSAKKRMGKSTTAPIVGPDGKVRDPLKRKLRRKKKPTTASQVLIKYAALLLLVAQMVGLVLLMRYSRTSHNEGEGPMYLASTAVFVMEAMKLAICCIVIAYQSGGNLMTELNLHVLQAPMEIAKLCVPSFLYTVQNNLLYLALTNLDAATYQVCYQLKILTTAVFSAIMLQVRVMFSVLYERIRICHHNEIMMQCSARSSIPDSIPNQSVIRSIFNFQRKFSPLKWFSLIVLTVGVAIVEVSGSKGESHTPSEDHNRFVGLIAVLCAACTSGFSGVYFEKILKGSQTSLWLRNVQMGLPSVIIAFITVFVKDSQAVAEQGFLGGYSPIVWTVVTVQAAGGLIVAVVVKYADNVLKVFATSFSIVVSCIISALFFDFHATFSFVIGASLVVIATIMYSKPEKKTKRKTVLPMTK
jgi:solute carrier family 35 (UDP-sugar transporter), member A1/2/3